MILKITERCLTKDDNDNEYYGMRIYTYRSSKEDFLEAINDLETNFDSDNIIDSEDDFPNECLNSDVIRYEIVFE